jgi:hypothetical protein
MSFIAPKPGSDRFTASPRLGYSLVGGQWPYIQLVGHPMHTKEEMRAALHMLAGLAWMKMHEEAPKRAEVVDVIVELEWRSVALRPEDGSPAQVKRVFAWATELANEFNSVGTEAA